MASITASNSAFSGPLLQDVNFNTSASFNAPTALSAVTSSTVSIYFPNIQYPTDTKFVVQLNLAPTGVVGAVPITASLQESSDNVTFTNVAIFRDILASNSGTGSTTTQVVLGPSSKPYIRAWANSPNSASATGVAVGGTFGITTLFV